MSNLQLIEKLCQLLDIARSIISEQAELLAEHGIYTDDGGLEMAEAQILADIENTI